MSVLSRRTVLSGLGCLGLAACEAGPEALEEKPEPLGDFKLGHTVVVTENARIGPLSRKASLDDWKTSLTNAIETRFKRYEGPRFYHIAMTLDAYVLALPGVPLIANPKSIVIASVTVWDDAAGGKINEEPKQITVLESISEETLLGSGLTQGKDEQMVNLSFNTARAIERWMRENEDWFSPDRPADAGTAENS